MRGWLRPKSAAEYCEISERTLWNWRKKGLKFLRVNRVTLVKISDLDEFIEGASATKKADIDKIVEGVMRGL